MVEKALKEALHNKVVWDGSKKSSIPKHLCLPSEATTAIAQCSVCSAFAHLKRRWSDSGDRPLGVDSRQGDYLKTVLLIRDDVHSDNDSNSNNSGRTTAAGQWQQDNGGKTVTAMKKNEASSWFSYFYSSIFVSIF